MSKNINTGHCLLIVICLLLGACQPKDVDMKQTSSQSAPVVAVATQREILKPYGHWVSDLRELHYQDSEAKYKIENANSILTTYYVIPKDEWLHSYHHISAQAYIENDMNTIFFRKNKRYQLVVRPGGLATLISDDNEVLYLARELQPFMKEKLK